MLTRLHTGLEPPLPEPQSTPPASPRPLCGPLPLACTAGPCGSALQASGPEAGPRQAQLGSEAERGSGFVVPGHCLDS